MIASIKWDDLCKIIFAYEYDKMWFCSNVNTVNMYLMIWHDAILWNVTKVIGYTCLKNLQFLWIKMFILLRWFNLTSIVETIELNYAWKALLVYEITLIKLCVIKIKDSLIEVHCDLTITIRKYLDFHGYYPSDKWIELLNS